MKPRLQRALVLAGGAALTILAAAVLPRWWCGRDARDFYHGDPARQEALAREVAARVERGIGLADFRTGSARFDGEWLFGTYQMAALGLMQVAREQPEMAQRYLPAAEACIARLLSAEVRQFDLEAWGPGQDPLETLGGHSGHAAYLGYLNVVLGLHRRLVPESPHAGLNDRITAALARRLAESPIRMIETYPGETYPVDNCAVAASIALYDQAAGADHRDLLDAWTDSCRRLAIDPESGLLIQAIRSRTGQPLDRPRASGTALACYLLGLAGHELSAELYAALRTRCFTTFLGFGLVREYPPGVPGGRGDIDSGPVLFGIGFSATGFALAGARMHGDAPWYEALYRTTYAVGAPLDGGGRRSYVCGGPLGNAIMLAMLTAPPLTPPRNGGGP